MSIFEANKHLKRMVNQKLLQALISKCKDMGLSEESIQAIAGIASEGLTDGSTDEEIEARANLFLPACKTMQGEATRWAQKAKGTQTPPQTPPETKPNNEAGLEEKILAKLEEKYGGVITQLQKQLNDSQRNSTISAEMQKLGLTTEDMEFITVPSDANVPEFLGKVKQSLVNRGLKPADTSVTKEAQETANNELAKTMLQEYYVKND
jgi:hypothetical protein